MKLKIERATMRKRQTITLDADVFKVLIEYRANYMLKHQRDLTMTEAINKILRKALKRILGE